jgi:hypothetical protein
MTGFAAASYMRGVPFVQVPTTLAGAGGLLGGWQDRHQPPAGQEHDRRVLPAAAVVCDLDTLTTLPARELSAGLAEVIKYGPIADMAFLDWIEANMAALLARDPASAGACGAAQLRDQGLGGGPGRARIAGCAPSSILAIPSATPSNRAWVMANGCMARPWVAAW